MTEEDISAPARRSSSRGVDLKASAVLIAERLVGEILGWDLVDWSAVERRKGRKFFFGRRRGDPSIYDQLKPLFDHADPGRNDFSPLKPSPLVNANLSRLVGFLCRHLGRHGLSGDGEDGRALARTAEQDLLHLATVAHLLARIEADPALGERAALLKRIAAAAESELEKHFADLMERLDHAFADIAHADMVNTTEVYRKITTDSDAINLDFDSCRRADDRVRDIEHVRAKLDSS